MGCVIVSVCALFTVHQSDPRACQDGGRAMVTSPTGFLSASAVTESQVDSSGCPWVISASQGQRINVTLLEFGSGGSVEPGVECLRRYAIVTDISEHKDHNICASNKRLSHAFTSKGSTIEIRIPDLSLVHKALFLLKYEGICCICNQFLKLRLILALMQSHLRPPQPSTTKEYYRKDCMTRFPAHILSFCLSLKAPA